MSFFFYGYGNWSYLGILTLSIMTNWTISQLIQNKWKWNKAFLVIGILFNIGLIFVFKYYDFFLENLNVILREDISILKLALPLGISFYTFQQISYLIDTYRGETKEYSFIEYAVFVSFFPQLVAGPIVLHKEIIPQLKKRKIKA